MLPSLVLTPPFNVTRASHVVLSVRDLAASRAFYEGVIGLEVSHADESAVYLRGLEEAAHHSLVLRRASGEPYCLRVGFRVATAHDIERAHGFLTEQGIEARLVEQPFQGATLHFTDPVGTAIEFTCEMDVVSRRMQDFHLHRGASPQRLDHYQVVSHDVQRATEFWAALGFRLTEYTATDGTDELWGAWLQRKGNTHDLVFTNGRGPRLHHFAYTVSDTQDLIHICDCAGSQGFGDAIDRGPGRHGISNALFVYLRDPDGHRIELFTTHYQAIDLETPPIRWDLSNLRRSQLWGPPASKRWFFEASQFPNQPVHEPLLSVTPVTLESVLLDQH